MALPQLRQLDAIPISHEGQTLICLRDPEGFVEEQLLVSPLAFFIASQLDGTSDVTDIQCAFARQYQGQLVMSEDVRKVVDFLDGHGFLISEKFLAMRRKVEEAFRQADVRQAYCAGKTYPNPPEELRPFLDGLFVRDGGPGEPPGPDPGRGTPLRCLVVPHIDLERGGLSYAHGYSRLYRQGRPETVLIFGVAHTTTPIPFVLTRKHFETPFGLMETDHALVDRLAAACSWDPYEHEIVHRTEHSIEFQALMLAYLFGADVRIVPILCGVFGAEDGSAAPAESPGVGGFLQECRAIASENKDRMTVIAAADLAHVGPRFGDAFDIDDAVVQTVERRDRQDLAHVTALEADAFYRSVMKDHNQRRVCGLNCIYASLKTVEGLTDHGELVHYGYAPDPAGGIVSFANIVFS